MSGIARRICGADERARALGEPPSEAAMAITGRCGRRPDAGRASSQRRKANRCPQAEVFASRHIQIVASPRAPLADRRSL